MSTSHPAIAALLIAVLSILVFWWATPYGLTVESGDAVVYLESARNVAAGHGYVYAIPPEPVVAETHFPPFYSYAIAAGRFLSHDIRGGAWLVNLLAFVATACFLGLLVLEAAPGRIEYALFAAALFVSNPILLRLNATVVSEPAFLGLGLAGQWLLLRAIKTERPWLLLAAALTIGLTPLVRYSGVVWVATAPLFLLFCGNGSGWARLRRAVVFGFISCLPLAALVVRNHSASGVASDRNVVWHVIDRGHIQDAFITVSSWFLPWRWMGVTAGVIVTLAMAVVAAAFLWLGARSESPEKRALSGARLVGVSIAIFIIVYVAHLIAAVSLVNYDTPLDGRILAPVAVAVICLLGAALALLVAPRARWAAALVGGALLVISLGRGYGWLAKNRQGQIGYLSPAWTQGPVAQFVSQLPPDAAVYSNHPEQVYFGLRRPVQFIPFKSDPMSRVPNKKVDEEMDSMVTKLRSTQGVIVYLHPPKLDQTYASSGGQPLPLSRMHEFSVNDLAQKFHLERVATDGLADIYRLAPL